MNTLTRNKLLCISVLRTISLVKVLLSFSLNIFFRLIALMLGKHPDRGKHFKTVVYNEFPLFINCKLASSSLIQTQHHQQHSVVNFYVMRHLPGSLNPLLYKFPISAMITISESKQSDQNLQTFNLQYHAVQSSTKIENKIVIFHDTSTSCATPQ